MNQKEFDQKLKEVKVTWNCRFHPTDYWHEIGCPHQKWSKEDLLGALISKKKFEQSGLRGTVLGN